MWRIGIVLIVFYRTDLVASWGVSSPFADCHRDRLERLSAEHVVLQDEVQEQVLLLTPVLRSLLSAHQDAEAAPRLAWYVVPYGVDQEQVPPVVVCAVHGTWSDPSEFGQNHYTLGTRYLRRTVAQLAYVYQRPVLLYSFVWSGALHAQQRTQAGDQLAYALAQLRFLHDPWQCWVIGHSHGCNVIAQALKVLQEQGQGPVDVAVYMASPAIEEERIPSSADALGARNLYVLHAAADVTGVVGSFEVQVTFEQHLGTFFYRHPAVRFALLRCGRQHLNHINSKTVACAHLLAIMQACHGVEPFRDLLIDVPYPGEEVHTSLSSPILVALLRGSSKNILPAKTTLQERQQELMARVTLGYDRALFASQYGIDIEDRPGACGLFCWAPFAELWQNFADAQAAAQRAEAAVAKKCIFVVAK